MTGANNVTGAMTGTLALFFGTDEMIFSLKSGSPLALQNPRTYARFSDAAQNVVDVRVYQGIHFRFADAAGRRQGKHVAKWDFKHFLRPVDDDHEDDENENDHEKDHDDDRDRED